MSMFLICRLVCSYTPPILDNNIVDEPFEGATTVSDTGFLGVIAKIEQCRY